MEAPFAGITNLQATPEAVSPYYIFMLRQTFMAIDDSYIEAARIDGLGRVGIITKILAQAKRRWRYPPPSPSGA